MAYSYAALSALETSWLASDKPLIGANVIPKSPTKSLWTEVGQTTSTDRTTTTAPASYAYDGQGGLRTTGQPIGSSTWYYVLDLGAGYEFDALALLGHNFGTLALTTAELQIADAGTFATNLQTVWSGTFASDSRYIGLDLHHTGSVPLRYSNVRYVRLKLAKGSAFVPSLGELILLRRRQFQYRPENPFDPSKTVTDQDSIRTSGGVEYVTVYNGGRFVLSAGWDIDDATLQSELSAWHRQARFGSAPFVWCEKPYSAPQSWNLVRLTDPSMNFPWLDGAPTSRRFEIEAEEQGPESYYLSSGVY